jgi:hypothetical protein
MKPDAQDETEGGEKIKPLAQLDNLLNELKKQADEEAKKSSKLIAGSFTLGTAPRTSINDKIREEKARRQKIANDILEKDHRLKEATLKKLFRFLSAETGVIFVLAFLQGFGWKDFELDQWSFRLVIAATLGQITAMLTIAVQHLFPKNKIK